MENLKMEKQLTKLSAYYGVLSTAIERVVSSLSELQRQGFLGNGTHHYDYWGKLVAEGRNLTSNGVGYNLGLVQKNAKDLLSSAGGDADTRLLDKNWNHPQNLAKQLAGVDERVNGIKEWVKSFGSVYREKLIEDILAPLEEAERFRDFNLEELIPKESD